MATGYTLTQIWLAKLIFTAQIEVEWVVIKLDKVGVIILHL